jgi:hypothetical protein
MNGRAATNFLSLAASPAAFAGRGNFLASSLRLQTSAIVVPALYGE